MEEDMGKFGIPTKCTTSGYHFLILRLFKDGKLQLDQWCGNNPVKLVRGAYLNQEPSDKVHGSKEAVDDMYNQALIDLILNRRNSVMLASHNYASVLKAISLLPQSRPPAWFQSRIVCFGQLYGMGDDITYALSRELKNIPVPPSIKLCVVKYVPYGPLEDVIPYLIRRAEENRGMLAGSMLEREALISELKRRILETLGQNGIH
jgi:proline dehydrogenase